MDGRVYLSVMMTMRVRVFQQLICVQGGKTSSLILLSQKQSLSSCVMKMEMSIPAAKQAESLPSSDHAVISSDPVPDDVDVMPIDVDPVVEQIQEEVCRADFLDWKSKGRKEKKAIIFQRKKKRRAREEVRKAEALDRHFEVACMALKAEKARKLMKRENNAKGHIPATPEEITAGSHVESDKKELARWALCGIFDLSSQTQHPRPGVKPITLRWVCTWKLKEEEQVAKSRLVAKGFQDARDNGFLETFSGTASSSLSRAAFVWALSRGLQAAKADISTAFLQAPLDGKNGEVSLRLPSDLPVSVYPGLCPGVCVRILKAVYGLKDSPRVYTQYFKKRVKELGWEEIAESILVKRDKNKKPVGVLVMYVDDLFAFAPDVMKEMQAIRSLFEMDEPVRIDDGSLHAYIGMSVRMVESRMLLDQGSYLQEAASSVPPQSRKPLTERDLLLPSEEEVDPSLYTEQQSNVGAL
eukprot:Cvel_25807.t2-p1 / transcript=Cvel_25807.t2 / gene=Cvel_25807 / organism=Chromera_velia_CCMP2878 / gene_product=Copia protein, putative / transcript_product=Copia protein, putative / location=Cvel_scaffold2974:3247-4936(+) / protein_length=468 / sequence_SO=supercontig / SO=protein_coding / is_pseudo=false